MEGCTQSLFLPVLSFSGSKSPLGFFYTYQVMITKGSFTKSFPNRQQLKIIWVRGSPLDFYLWFRVSRIQFPHTNLCLWLRTKSKADFYLNRRLTCTLFSNVCVVRNFHWERQKMIDCTNPPNSNILLHVFTEWLASLIGTRNWWTDF